MFSGVEPVRQCRRFLSDPVSHTSYLLGDLVSE